MAVKVTVQNSTGDPDGTRSRHGQAGRGSPSACGGYTVIPCSVSITGRSVWRTDSRASPVTRGPFGERPVLNGLAGGLDARRDAGVLVLC